MQVAEIGDTSLFFPMTMYTLVCLLNNWSWFGYTLQYMKYTPRNMIKYTVLSNGDIQKSLFIVAWRVVQNSLHCLLLIF